MQVDLLRHGATEHAYAYCGALDVSLSALGREQMEAAVAGGQWDLIYTSPLRRCDVMAQTFAQRLGIDCHRDARLRELNFGCWEGRSAEQLLAEDGAALNRFWSDPFRYSPPGGESVVALTDRVLSFWRDCIEPSTAARVLVVTHGGPIRILLNHYFQSSPGRLLEHQVPHAARFTLDVYRDVAASPET